MSRLRRIENRDRIFFVTTNLAPGVTALAPVERHCVMAQLQRQRATNDFKLFGYVVMPTHLHLLLRPESLGLSALMHRFKRFTAAEINRRRGTNAAVWQPRYFDFILRRVGDFWDKLEYIHNNPVESGNVSAPAAWLWSSAAHYLSAGPVLVPVDPVDFPSDSSTLLWPAPWRRL